MNIQTLEDAKLNLSFLPSFIIVTEGGKVYEKPSDYLMATNPKDFLELVVERDDYEIEFKDNTFNLYIKGSTTAIEDSYIPWCEVDNALCPKTLIDFLEEKIDLFNDNEIGGYFNQEELDDIERHFKCWITPLLEYKNTSQGVKT